MNRLKSLTRQHSTLFVLLFAQFFPPTVAHAQNSDALTLVGQGHGVIADALEERKFTGARAVLRADGTALIALFSDLQLHAQATWSANNSSPQEILLKITGGEVIGNATGTGKLLLNKDRTSIKELTIKGRFFDGRQVLITFVADAPSDSQKGSNAISVQCVAPMRPCPQESVPITVFNLRF